MCGFLLALIMGRAMHGLYLYFVSQNVLDILAYLQFGLSVCDSSSRYQILSIGIMEISRGEPSFVVRVQISTIVILDSHYIILIELAKRQFKYYAFRISCGYPMSCTLWYNYIFSLLYD